jgi:hypothetical protein
VTRQAQNAAWTAHQDILDIFRANGRSVADACRIARDRLASISIGDPERPQSWDAYRILAADLQTLLCFMNEQRVPSSEPTAFRSFVIDVLVYLYETEQGGRGSLIAREVHRRWSEELGRSHRDTMSAAERLAACLHASGDGTAALPIFREVLRLRSQTKGPDAPGALTRHFHSVAA